MNHVEQSKIRIASIQQTCISQTAHSPKRYSPTTSPSPESHPIPIERKSAMRRRCGSQEEAGGPTQLVNSKCGTIPTNPLIILPPFRHRDDPKRRVMDMSSGSPYHATRQAKPATQNATSNQSPKPQLCFAVPITAYTARYSFRGSSRLDGKGQR